MGLSHGIGVCVVLIEVCFERLLGGAGGGGTLGCETGGVYLTCYTVHLSRRMCSQTREEAAGREGDGSYGGFTHLSLSQ